MFLNVSIAGRTPNLQLPGYSPDQLDPLPNGLLANILD